MKKNSLISGFALILAVSLLISALCPMPLAFASTYEELYVDPETGAVQSEDGAISMDEWQSLMYPMMAIAPSAATITLSFKLEGLSTEQLTQLASGTVPNAKNIKTKITFKTTDGTKFRNAAISILSDGNETLLYTHNNNKSEDKMEYEQAANSSPISSDAANLFDFMTGTVRVTVTDDGTDVFTARLSDDTVLLDLIDRNVITNWSGILFYRSTELTASVSPAVSSVTAENELIALTATPANAADSTCYLWQEAPLNVDGSLPETGWTNTDMTGLNEAVTADMTNIAKAWRCLAFPDEASRTACLNGSSDVLYKASNTVSIMSEHDRTEVFPQITGDTDWEDLQVLLAVSNFPGTFTISQPYVLDNNSSYLTLDHLAALASGTVPTGDKNTGYSLTLTIATGNNNKFTTGTMYSGTFGQIDTLIGSVNNKDLTSHAVTFKNGTVSADDLFVYLKAGSIYEELVMSDSSVQRKDFAFGVTADQQLQALLDADLVNNWSDLYFYRAAQGTASAVPMIIYSTADGAQIGLQMDVPADPDGTNYEYLWERAPISTDGSMPDDTAEWEWIADGRNTSVTADLDSILYAYRAVVFPNAAAKDLYQNNEPTLCLKSNIVTLMAEEKREMIYPAAFAEGFVWEDLQYLLSDDTIIADVYYYSSVFGDRPQPQLAGTETLTGRETDEGTVHYVSPDQMHVTLKIGVGGANSYEWYRSDDDGASWALIETTDVPEYDMHMDASTATYIYRCIATREGVAPFTSGNCTFQPIAGCVWGGTQSGDTLTYYGYLPETGNSAANHNSFGDTYADHNNRGQYAFAPAQNPQISEYESDGSEAGMDKWVPEEAGKEGNANVNREYTIHLKADFESLREPDPVIYLITSDMDYATSDLGYARNWDPTIYNIGTGTEIKGALNAFANLVTSDYSGSFIGFSYTGHDNLPGNNYLFAFPYFTDNNAAANNAFSTLHTYGVCGNGHWDSGFSQIATCFAQIDRSVVETYLFGDDQNRLKSIKRVAISIAGSNENGYGGNSKNLNNLFGKNYVSGQDLWYGILTTDGTGQHWLKNSQSAMGRLYTGCVTQSSIYSALASIHRSVYNPCLYDVELHDTVRAEFEVKIPSGATVVTENGLRTATWTDDAGDVYTAVWSVDGNGKKLKDSTTEVTVLRSGSYYYLNEGSFEKTIEIRACNDYIGSNDVFTNLDPASLTYTNGLGEEKTIFVDESKKPTVNVPIKLMDPSTIQNWILKGDSTDLDALGEEFLQDVYDYVYSYEQVYGTLDLTWMKDSSQIAQSDIVRLDRTQNPRPFPETDTTENPLANVSDRTDFEGIMHFEPDEATNGKISVFVEQGQDFAHTTLTVIPVTPVFAPQSDAVWLGEPLKVHNPSGWTVASVAERFAPSLPAKTSVADITDEVYTRLNNRLDDLEYLSRLNFTLCNSDWTEVSEDPITGDTVIEDLERVGFTKEYKLAVCSLLNGEEVPLYDSVHTAGTYPVYTIYQAKPVFNVWSYTMGLTKNTTATSIPIVRSGLTGLVSSEIPATAPAWASSQQALWTMLRNSFSAYQDSLIYSFTESTEENPTVTGLYSDEILTTDGTGMNLLLTEQHAHGTNRPITPNIEVRLAVDADPFTVLNPKLYVVGCELTLKKVCIKASSYLTPNWDEDWRFPMDVEGPGLNDMTVILAPNSQVTLSDLVAGTYTVEESADWITSIGTGEFPIGYAWTSSNPYQRVSLSVQLRGVNESQWRTTPVYRSDNSIAESRTNYRNKEVEITNVYWGANTYLEEQVTNVYQNGSWSQK